MKRLEMVLAWLNARRKRQLAVVLFLSLMGGFAELASISAVVPFLAIVADADTMAGHPRIDALLSSLTKYAGADRVSIVTFTFCAIVVAAAAIRITLTWANTRFAQGVGHDLALRVHERLLLQPYPYHLSHNSSELLGGINKVQVVVNGVIYPAIDSAVALFLASAILTGLILVDWQIALVAAVLFSSVYVTLIKTSRVRIRQNSEQLSSATNSRIQALQESLGSIRDVIIDNTQAYHLRRFAEADETQRKAQVSNALWIDLPRYGVEALGVSVIASLVVFAQARPGGMAALLPTLGALALGAQRLLPLFQRLYAGCSALNATSAILSDVATLATLPKPHVDPIRDRRKIPFQKHISLTGLGFRFGAGLPWILRGVSIEIPRGARVGIVGETGSGKSTLLDIIMGLLSPVEGQLKVDGVEISAENRHHWQARIAHVPQQIYLADLSIAENIALGESPESLDQKRLEAAAHRARAAEFIEQLPERYHTLVGERGVRLSGGQRQRIGIARALYRSADVLVLDEATSALDSGTEASVMDGLEEVGGDITVLIVTHRLDTIRGCDFHLSLDGKTVVSQSRGGGKMKRETESRA